jgi:hypothetical protein
MCEENGPVRCVVVCCLFIATASCGGGGGRSETPDPPVRIESAAVTRMTAQGVPIDVDVVIRPLDFELGIL